jgi:UDP-glucose 4-epimerase
MKILVTGGAGFVGSHVVDAYLAAGHEVIVIDNLSTGKGAQVNQAARLVVIDVNDPALIDLVRSEAPDIINHHAANASVAVSVKRPLFDATQNILGTLNLLEAARQAQVGRFIYISSGGAMYGNPQQLPMDERHPSNPVSPYALSKHTGERYLRVYGEEHGLSWTSLRYANVYGPRQDPHGEAGVIAVFCQNLIDGIAPEIHWDGEQTRDFVYVADCASANLAALQAEGNQAYNVGTGIGTSINALFNTLMDVSGMELSPRRGPRRPGDARHSYLDCGRIKGDWGWQATTSLPTGLAKTWQHFLASQATSEPVQSGPASKGIA